MQSIKHLTAISSVVALAAVVSACASERDANSDATEAFTSALGVETAPMAIDAGARNGRIGVAREKLAGTPDLNDAVFGSDIGTSILDAYAKVMTDPSYYPVGQGIGGPKLPTDPNISGGAAGSPTVGAGGVGSSQYDNYGLPTGPSSSLSDFAAQLCAYTIGACSEMVACMQGASFDCGQVFSGQRCQSWVESGLQQRSVTTAPFVLTNAVRCADAYFKTIDCSSGFSGIIKRARQACGPALPDDKESP